MNASEYYAMHYSQSWLRLQDGAQSITIDKCKEIELDVKRPTIFVDIDHTCLHSGNLRRDLSAAFALYDRIFAPQVWLDTYEDAKIHETFYDYQLHIHRLVAHSGGARTFAELETLNAQVIEKSIKSRIYPNLAQKLNEWNKDHNLIIYTAGHFELHQLKISALIYALEIKPLFCTYLENIPKGIALQKIMNHIPELEHIPLTIVDDNVAELDDLTDRFSAKQVELIRVLQPEGKYNHKEIIHSDRIKVWDFRTSREFYD